MKEEGGWEEEREREEQTCVCLCFPQIQRDKRSELGCYVASLCTQSSVTVSSNNSHISQ